MIVCVCNAIRENDVREAARQGADNVRTMFRQFECRPKCAQCLRFAESILAEERCAAA